MDAQRREWGWKLTKEEKGFSPSTAKPLGKPARHLLKRIQDQYVKSHVLAAKYADGTLNSKTQALLVPPLTRAQKAVAYALSQQGVHESPWGSNRGADVVRYQSSTHNYGVAWCASFYWYCWQRAGYRGNVSAGAWYTTDRIGTRVNLSHARPGDAVSFDIGDGHVGMYLSHNKSYVKTIDGNTADQVAVRERPIHLIHNISRPN